MIFKNGIKQHLDYDGNLRARLYISGVIVNFGPGIIGAGTMYAGNYYASAGYYA